MATENISFPVDQCCESANRELKIIETRLSNYLILIKASEINSPYPFFPLITLNPKEISY